MKRILTLPTAGLLVAAVIAPHAALSAPPAKSSRDPTEIVCERIEIVGTRLGSRRVCMTRGEWAAQRQADRQLMDRSQTQGACVVGSISAGAQVCGGQ